VSEVAPVGMGNTRPLGYPISKDFTVDEALSGRIVAWFTPRMAESIRDASFDYLLPSFGCSEESEDSSSYDEFSDESTAFSLASAADLVIEVINLHSGRWRNLHLDVSADIPERLCGSIQPNQLLFLELGIDGGTSPTPKFVMKSKPFPTQLTLINFPPTSIDIGWDNITRAILCNLTANECLEVLRASTCSGILSGRTLGRCHGQLGTTILHRRLRSLNSSYSGTRFLEAINVPSLEEWIHNTEGDPLPVTAMVSLLKRSGCCLKILNLQTYLSASRRSFHFISSNALP
jgi:hypothetical protein